MDTAATPRLDLAQSVLPPPLLAALRHIFAQGVFDTMLVGGTALAGFYAGHRRSDDLDLFCKSGVAHKALVLAVASLRTLGVSIDAENRSAQFYRATCRFEAHRFTVDAVLDEHLFDVGESLTIDGLAVASLRTLAMTKSATLVSRCSEKDLYDLIWILEHLALDLPQFVDLGQRVDGGVNAENVLLVTTGTTLSQEACDFALYPARTAEEVFAMVQDFKTRLEETLSRYLHGQPIPPLGRLVRRLRGSRRPG